MPKLASKKSDSVVSSMREGNSSVYYEKSITKNLGNYESAKVTVGVTLPICPTKDEIAVINETLEIGDEIVTKELEVQLKELTEDK